MVDEPRGADFTIWCVAALLYLFDAAKLLSARELLVVEAGRGRLAAILSEHPFTLAGRVLAFAPVLRPDRGVWLAPWGQPWAPDGALRAAIEAVERLRALLVVPRVLATAGFALLFGVGPVLTLLLGPNAAVVYTAAGVYPAVFSAVGWLWWRRRALGLTVAHSALVSGELVVCPAFLPNLVRKITAAHALPVDGAQILGATAAAEVKDEALSRLASRAEEAIEAASPGSSEATAMRGYLARLRGEP